MGKSIWARRRAAYKENFKGLGCGLPLAWRNLPAVCGRIWPAVRDLARAVWFLLLVLFMPLLTPLVPLLAAYGVWHDERQAARRKSAPRDWLDEPDEHETHCGCSDCF